MKQHEEAKQYRLHHFPFLVMWVASFGVAWLGLFLAAMLWNDAKSDIVFFQELSNWVYTHARWIDGVVMGAGLGALLALVQPWLMRWRYGFVPRFWRITTFIGAILGGSFFSEFIYNNGYYDLNGVWTYPNPILPIVVWFGSLTLVQALALWPVVRRGWLYPLAGSGAIGASLLMGMNSNYGMTQPNMLIFGSMAQAVFSGALLLWLMRDYRVEAVAKRDEKSKAVVRVGLHPISFIGLWAMAHFFAWVSFMVCIFIYDTLRHFVPFMSDLAHWIFNIPMLFYPLIGLLIGGMTSLAQPWLIQQQSGIRPQLWLRLSFPAWALAGLALITLMGTYYEKSNLEIGLALLAWFSVPPLVQSYSLWRDMRGAWLYALSGIVSAVVAYLVYLQMEWTGNGNDVSYAVILGAGVQAILTGAAFLTINAQNQQTQAQEPIVETLPQEA